MSDVTGRRLEDDAESFRPVAAKKLAKLVLNTANRYDLLFGKHVEMFLLKENRRNKKALSLAFVEKTINDIVSMLRDDSLKLALAEYVCDSTESVVSQCTDDGVLSEAAMQRLHFGYVYCINLIPTNWRKLVCSFESIFYRDMTRVYDRYIVVKTVMTDMFKKLTDTVLQAVFGLVPNENCG